MKNRIFYTSATLLIMALGAIGYMNAITLPSKIRMSVIDEIENATGKKILIQSISFDVLKGFVLERPVLYDKAGVIIRAEEVSCGILVLPILNNRIIIPSINIESPRLLLERRTDNSFNISELMPKARSPKGDFSVSLHRITMKNAEIDFVDKAFPVPAVKKINNADINIRLSIPVRVRFDIECEIPASSKIEATLRGEYVIPTEEFSARIEARNFSPKDFSEYYSQSGIVIQKGTMDAGLDIRVKKEVITADIKATSNELFASFEKINAKMNSGISVHAQYDAINKKLEYAGTADIRAMDIRGIDVVEKLDNIKAKVEFSDSRLSSKDISITAFGIPWHARINMVNFKRPVFDLYADSEIHLSALQKILEDKFNIKLATNIAGKSHLELSLQTEPGEQARLNGYIRTSDATIGLGTAKFPLEHVKGEAQFTSNSIKWADVGLTYRSTAYRTSGELTNFASPGVQLEVKSKNLSCKSIFAVNNKIITLTHLKGKYLNSLFSVSGKLDLEDPDTIEADINGTLGLEMTDMKSITKPSPETEKMKLSGRLNAEFTLNGDVNNIKACEIEARVKSDLISVYGLELGNIAFNYIQQEGSGYIKSLQSLFYGGLLSAEGDINWYSKDLPYSFNINTKGVKLEKLKQAFDFKDKDVSGDIKIYANVNSFLEDFSRISAIGKISIAKGRLWQLNLFQGLGVLIFTSDFNDIVFDEGSCDFKINDKVFSTSDLALNSDLLKLYGSLNIGFDKSVSGSLKSELGDEAMSPGFKKNIASAIGKYTFIELSGTVTDPKYKIRPSFSDIVSDMTSKFIQQQ